MEQVLNYLNKLLKDNDKVVVAISGGPDSMGLLDLLWEIKKRKNINIIVAHVNHKLRKESEEEKDFVEDYAKKKKLIYEYMEIKEYGHDNLENDARNKRYEFFKSLVNKYKAQYLMTAHHGDDLIETIMMRLVRGSSIKGYSGFKKEVDMGSYKLIRPLITVTKADILQYLENKNLKYYIDKSNNSLVYTRNRYRKKVLPFLKKEEPNVHLKFLKFSEELEQASNFINERVKEILKDIKNKEGIQINKLLKYDDFLIKKIIEYELSLIYTNDLFRVSDSNTMAIMNLIKLNKSNGIINLPKGYIAIKDYNIFKIEYNKDREEYYYILEQEVVLPQGVIRVIPKSEAKSNYVIRLNSKDITLPIIIRSKKDGDKMTVKNMKGSKKIKDIFIDEIISTLKRKNAPVVCDSNNNILWLPGVKKSKFDVESNGIYDIILSYEEDI